MSALLGIDLGTEGARVAVFTGDGTVLGTGRHGYPTRYPRPGWAEQDPEDWWRAVVRATRAALTEAGDPEVAGVAVATTASTVVACDDAGRPLRPAILWMDGRAGAESELTGRTGHEVLRYSGGSDAVEWLVPKAMWLARHERRTYERAARIVEAVDYLTWRLTGTWTATRMNAVCKSNHDPRGTGYPAELYALLGVPDLVKKLPPTVLPVGAVAGEATDAARAELGLRGRPAVAVGGIDAHLSLLATGGLAPGRLSVVCGTSNAFVAEIDEPVFTPAIWGPYPDALRTGYWLVEGGQVSAGSVLRWMSEDLLGYTRERLPELCEEAGRVGPGEHGLTVLDYFMGNRTPLRDPGLRGAVLGLTLGTTPAQLYRAAVEGVAYGTRQVLESFLDAGVPVEEIYVSGGIRHNPLWLQTTADVLGRPLRLVGRPDGAGGAGDNLTLRACAVIAATAVGAQPDLATAAAAFTPVTTLVEPSAQAGHTAAYDEGYALYRQATQDTREVSHRLGRPWGERDDG
ncbi:FGGY-family pentulose kinase [Thermomonospora echinospora]|uniref:FGGY-family pentulose kinase n=1 Tax=Thermomonospora echinospora TaxID=1992 RepID=A0A1H6CNG9_9ACTN|nr:FGGY-family carbohydrate kinase [Thermomonospora echinospora]SEG74569.1 FGGY-family pentulose kinase [Thermomonospora echinospora]